MDAVDPSSGKHGAFFHSAEGYALKVEELTAKLAGALRGFIRHPQQLHVLKSELPFDQLQIHLKNIDFTESMGIKVARFKFLQLDERHAVFLDSYEV